MLEAARFGGMNGEHGWARVSAIGRRTTLWSPKLGSLQEALRGMFLQTEPIVEALPPKQMCIIPVNGREGVRCGPQCFPYEMLAFADVRTYLLNGIVPLYKKRDASHFGASEVVGASPNRPVNLSRSGERVGEAGYAAAATAGGPTRKPKLGPWFYAASGRHSRQWNRLLNW